MVFTATTARRRSVPARVDPALKPNHPKARMKQPRKAMDRSWPGMATALPFTYFPMRGPRIQAPVRAMTPPVRCTTPEPAKST